MKNVLDKTVSWFAHCKETDHPKDINLERWLRDESYRDTVEAIRHTDNEEEQKRLKMLLPGVTISGTFNRRYDDCLVEHSGLVALDIDEQDNRHIKNFNNLKQEIAKFPNVAYCGCSVRGKGYFVIIPVAYPRLHNEHFKALMAKFRSFGIVIDKLCGNVSRFRFQSYDPEAYFNPYAEPYTEYILPQPPKQLAYNAGDRDSDAERLITLVCTSHVNIVESYDDWFKTGCALASEFGERGRPMFHSLSSQSSKYNLTECDKQYSNCLRDKRGYTIATLFYLCQQNNIDLKQCR